MKQVTLHVWVVGLGLGGVKGGSEHGEFGLRALGLAIVCVTRALSRFVCAPASNRTVWPTKTALSPMRFRMRVRLPRSGQTAAPILFDISDGSRGRPRRHHLHMVLRGYQCPSRQEFGTVGGSQARTDSLHRRLRIPLKLHLTTPPGVSQNQPIHRSPPPLPSPPLLSHSTLQALDRVASTCDFGVCHDRLVFVHLAGRGLTAGLELLHSLGRLLFLPPHHLGLFHAKAIFE